MKETNGDFRFVNVKNERVYHLTGYRRFKDYYRWITLVEFTDNEDSVLLRRPEDFHRSFVPLQCWKTATKEQRDKMKAEAAPIVPPPEECNPQQG